MKFNLGLVTGQEPPNALANNGQKVQRVQKGKKNSLLELIWVTQLISGTFFATAALNLSIKSPGVLKMCFWAILINIWAL